MQSNESDKWDGLVAELKVMKVGHIYLSQVKEQQVQRGRSETRETNEIDRNRMDKNVSAKAPVLCIARYTETEDWIKNTERLKKQNSINYTSPLTTYSVTSSIPLSIMEEHFGGFSDKK